MKTKLVMKPLALFAIALTAFSQQGMAQTLDCAALRNSMFAEPAGYAAQCLNVTSAPSSPQSTLAPTDFAITLDIRGNVAAVPPRPANTAYQFRLNNFPAQTAIGAFPASIFALDTTADLSTTFGVSASTATPPLTVYSVNLGTGALATLGVLTGLTAGDSPTGLTIHPSTGAAFLSAGSGTPFVTRLYSVNLTTRVATLIGPMTAPTDPTGTLMIDIAMNCNGDLFAHNTSDDALYRINVATGAGTAFPTHGLPANFAQGMDFDNDTGTLYAFIYTGAGNNRFGTFNLTTGAFTSLATDNPLGEYEGTVLTVCPSGAPVLPSISLTKRVQLTAGANNICTAAGTSVTLPFGGGAVDYCYTVFNTGTTPLITHNLTDPAFVDPILVNLQFVLNPTNGVFVRATKTVTRTESTGATWSACNQANNCTGAVVASASVAAGTIVAGVAEVAANAFGTWGLGLLLLGVGAVSLLAVRRYS